MKKIIKSYKFKNYYILIFILAQVLIISGCTGGDPIDIPYISNNNTIRYSVSPDLRDPELGWGFDTPNGNFKVNTAFVNPSNNVFIDNARPNEGHLRAVLIENSMSEFRQNKIDINLTAKYLTNRAEGNLQKVTNFANSSRDITFYVLYDRFYDIPLNYPNPNYNNRANTYLLQKNFVAFKNVFGDQYINRIIKGHVLSIKYKLTANSDQEKSDLLREINASINVFNGGGTVSAGFRNILERAQQSSQLSVEILNIGGPSTERFLTVSNNLNELRTIAAGYISELNTTNAKTVEFFVEKYPGLPDIPSVEEIINGDFVDRYLLNLSEIKNIENYLRTYSIITDKVEVWQSQLSIRQNYKINLRNAASEYFGANSDRELKKTALLSVIAERFPMEYPPERKWTIVWNSQYLTRDGNFFHTIPQNLVGLLNGAQRRIRLTGSLTTVPRINGMLHVEILLGSTTHVSQDFPPDGAINITHDKFTILINSLYKHSSTIDILPVSVRISSLHNANVINSIFGSLRFDYYGDN